MSMAERIDELMNWEMADSDLNWGMPPEGATNLSTEDRLGILELRTLALHKALLEMADDIDSQRS
jgi:hypothetical protein